VGRFFYFVKRWLDRVPGGMMLVPLCIGALLRTLWPNLFASDNTLFRTSFTGGLLTGAVPFLAAFYVCLGSTIDLRQTGYIVKKGFALWIGKIGTAAAIGVLIRLFAGSHQNDVFLGLSALAIVAALSDTNGGLYMALMAQLGSKVEDVAAYSIMSLESGPFFTMLILGVTGLASFPLVAFVFAILPLLIGVALGNWDPEWRAFLKNGPSLLIPFFAVALGTGIDLTKVASAGISGVLLGLFVVVLTGIVLFVIDRLTGGNGLAGLAASSTAGNAAAVPPVVAAIYVAYAPIAALATVQVSACVIVTAILTPVVTAWYATHIAPRTRSRGDALAA
jgi:2-keto-3-deoxygluconate permease